MKLKRISASFASSVLIASGSIGMNLIAATSPLNSPAQAQSTGQGVNTRRGCFLNTSFNGEIAFNPTNVRQQTTTQSSLAEGFQFKRVGEIVNFSGVTVGQDVRDAWDGQLDNMWYRYRFPNGKEGWVASAVIKGYPPRANCINSNAESFFNWAVNKTGVSRYDLGSEYNGQCVTLVVRYLQDVYFRRDRSSRAYGHGKDVALGVSAKHPKLFQFKTSGTPKRGAIISFKGARYDATYGHVGIVMETSNSSIKILESNYDGLATRSVVRISDWKSRVGVVGWADPIGNLP